jgi:hypothetical protein
MLRIAIVCCVLAGSASVAAAGICVGEGEIEDSVKALEQVAKNPKAKPEPSYWEACVRGVPEHYPQFGKRVTAACEKMLSRDPKYVMCIEVGAHLGHKQLAGVDFYSEISSRKLDPWLWHHIDLNVFLLGKIGDPRATPLIVEAWKANLEEAAKREKRKNKAASMMQWSGWRQDAARALAIVGGAAEKPFLEEQAKATKDGFVRKACLDAVAAIDKRLAAKPAAP